MKNNYCQLYLSCADKKEAEKLARTLLIKQMVACVKQIPVSSDYWWQGKIEHSDEILLVMESKMELFDKVQKEVAKLHSHKTFVLEAIPVLKVSKKARQWLVESLNV